MTTYGTYFVIPGATASADLSSYQYTIVKAATWPQIQVASAATDSILGVLQNDPNAAGQPAEVACLGVCKVIAGGSITVGDHVTTNSTGYAATTTSANNHVLGVALDTASTSGDIIRVCVNISNY